ncbi:(R)-stereoselective amidase [Andreprevotia sp. IGB-42]|uniref:nitrilase family protein n=1 Tax=Andreprevotia sp. IGB-42 TaxID=2497473 RepID=UPI001359C658|nr:nitrilase family protein [Andreprevotia sp. IGB-42]KAF0815223.1 (R)-stereoselective amidase [Andreprevotia sp. IGB-42]
MSAPTLRAASVQFQHRAGDKAYNLSQIGHFAGQAAAQQVQLLVFPEMCICGYWHVPKLGVAALEALAEPLDGPSINAVAALAQQSGIAIGAGWLERADDGRLFNSYAVCMPDGARHVHRKLHAFEHVHIHSGERYTVFDTPWGIRAGILICWDNNLVENARATALAGATLLIAPHQTGGTNSRSPHSMKPIALEKWQQRHSNPAAIEAEFKGPNGREWLLRWLPARAHDNGLFVIFSNGVGQDDDEVRTGNAMILDPYGRILSETWAAADAMVVADLDLGLTDMSTGQRWLRGRRPELYGVLAERMGNELNPRDARFSAASTKTPPSNVSENSNP